ncbi:Bax inhibitor-1/YccA family protein [Actinopolymorpha rutila]|uniref:Putative YccA/Bax inhibitor family protein n=1 Tax=Actinopolymorpha rutila TaxID=446787 RepID=A0A852Z609_9ACTN|nr:Bax inhibitor-1/YccA family protein [Actinopolymorpha rutila]NYH88757.1 putative YccA/Bax inhibitor family protein [Actinopolymorpha rutila]
MQSKNPVFRRSDAFQSAGSGAAGMSADQLREMYDAPSYSGTRRDRMTIDDVVARTAMTLGTLIVVAGATWFLTGPVQPAHFGWLIGAALVGMGLGFVIGLKHITNPAVILGYAAVEGVFVGLASKVLSAYAGDSAIVAQAVLGTMCASAGMLAVYKFRVIRVTPKFQRFVVAATLGFFLIVAVNLVLRMFGLNLGVSGLGGLGLVFAVIGVALACFNLLLDFDYVEKGIAAGAPSKDAWFAAFGLTVTLVWLYIELLRILAILRGGD